MDIYVLIYEENSDSRCGASVDLFQDIKDAQKEMVKGYQGLIQSFGVNDCDCWWDDDHYYSCGNSSATICNRMDSYHWRIEGHSLMSQGGGKHD